MYASIVSIVAIMVGCLAIGYIVGLMSRLVIWYAKKTMNNMFNSMNRALYPSNLNIGKQRRDDDE